MNSTFFASGTLGLEDANTPGTAKVLGSPVLFLNGKFSVPKKIVDLLYVCLC